MRQITFLVFALCFKLVYYFDSSLDFRLRVLRDILILFITGLSFFLLVLCFAKSWIISKRSVPWLYKT